MLRLLECPGEGGGFREVAADKLGSVRDDAGRDVVMWVDAVEPTADEVRALGQAFGMHRLVIENLAGGGQRQKAEEFGDQLLVVLRLPRAAAQDAEPGLALDEIALVVGEHWLVSVHGALRDFGDETAALSAARRDVARNGAVAVLTGLLDRAVDRYEDLVDVLGAEVEEQDRRLLDEAAADPVPELRRAGRVRHAVLELRRATGQLRELVGVLVRHELVDREHSDELDLELRDVYDHVVRAHDDLDVLYERLASLADTRLALTAYRQNEITKRLSAWGAILLVPTVVTGWFGMNFRDLSLLGWRHGQVVALAVVGLVCLALYLGLRRARWL